MKGLSLRPYQSLTFSRLIFNMSQEISDFVQWVNRWTTKVRSLETWAQRVGPPCEVFFKMLKNDEYEKFVTLFPQVFNNAKALVLLPWFADGLLQEAARLKRAQFYPDLVRFASPQSLFESI